MVEWEYYLAEKSKKMQDDTTPNLLADENSNISSIIQGLVDRGFSHEYFWINDESYSRLTKHGYKAWLTRNARLSYPMTNPAVSYVCKNKNVSYDYAKRLGVKTPYTKMLGEDMPITALNGEELLKLCNQLVVKPADSAQSKGLTLNISTPAELKKALLYAREYSKDVLIQKQVDGEEARFIVFEGKASAVLLRQTPQLVGDGESTVQQLFDAENKSRKEIVDSAVLYPSLSSKLIEKYDSSLIPANQEVLELSRSTLIRDGASVYDIISTIDHSYIQIVQSIAQHLGADFIVIDLMMKDYKAPADGINYSLIEFNELPSLKLCYSCRDGNHYDILGDLLPLIELTLKH